jgi:hypothetical protein
MAKKKVSDPRPVALDALAAALADATAKVLFGTKTLPGFFMGTAAATKAAAQLCLDEGWLETTGQDVKVGKAMKPLYRITPQGAQAVLDNSPAPTLLRALADAALRQQADLQALSATLRILEGSVRRLVELIPPVADKVKAPDVAALVAALAANHTPSRDGADGPDDDIVRRVAGLDIYNALPLPRLFQDLRQARPDLTVGRFHDVLRTLYEADRIRLLPYTQALGGIGGAREALFLDGEVMFHVCGS